MDQFIVPKDLPCLVPLLAAFPVAVGDGVQEQDDDDQGDVVTQDVVDVVPQRPRVAEELDHNVHDQAGDYDHDDGPSYYVHLVRLFHDGGPGFSELRVQLVLGGPKYGGPDGVELRLGRTESVLRRLLLGIPGTGPLDVYFYIPHPPQYVSDVLPGLLGGAGRIDHVDLALRQVSPEELPFQVGVPDVADEPVGIAKAPCDRYSSTFSEVMGHTLRSSDGSRFSRNMYLMNVPSNYGVFVSHPSHVANATALVV